MQKYFINILVNKFTNNCCVGYFFTYICLMKNKKKPGTKPKYGVETMVSAIRHPKEKLEEVKAAHDILIKKFEKQYSK